MSRIEYAVEVYDKEDRFDMQLDVFSTYEEANNFKENCNEKLYDGEHLGILAINYDEDGNETSVERL